MRFLWNGWINGAFLVIDNLDCVIIPANELTLGILRISLNDRKDSDDSAYPDDNPQHGQHRAHFMRQD